MGFEIESCRVVQVIILFWELHTFNFHLIHGYFVSTLRLAGKLKVIAVINKKVLDYSKSGRVPYAN